LGRMRQKGRRWAVGAGGTGTRGEVGLPPERSSMRGRANQNVAKWGATLLPLSYGILFRKLTGRDRIIIVRLENAYSPGKILVSGPLRGKIMRYFGEIGFGWLVFAPGSRYLVCGYSLDNIVTAHSLEFKILTFSNSTYPWLLLATQTSTFPKAQLSSKNPELTLWRF